MMLLAYVATLVTFCILPDVELTNLQSVLSVTVVYIAWICFVGCVKKM